MKGLVLAAVVALGIAGQADALTKIQGSEPWDYFKVRDTCVHIKSCSAGFRAFIVSDDEWETARAIFDVKWSKGDLSFYEGGWHLIPVLRDSPSHFVLELTSPSGGSFWDHISEHGIRFTIGMHGNEWTHSVYLPPMTNRDTDGFAIYAGQPVPLPASALLLLTGVAGLALRKRRSFSRMLNLGSGNKSAV